MPEKLRRTIGFFNRVHELLLYEGRIAINHLALSVEGDGLPLFKQHTNPFRIASLRLLFFRDILPKFIHSFVIYYLKRCHRAQHWLKCGFEVQSQCLQRHAFQWRQVNYFGI